MRLQFRKYQGTGNDFIMIDNRNGDIRLSDSEIIRVCDRKFGIGSDGIILLQKASQADFEMIFHNPDASKSFCGNGSRCIVQFAHDIGAAPDHGSFLAIDGLHDYRFNRDRIAIHMKDIHGIDMDGDAYVINTGSPHYIKYVSELGQINIVPEARQVRYAPRYSPAGINVNFVEENDRGISIRTYERGVEDETLSCGTGVTAAALSYACRNPGRQNVQVITQGGELNVEYIQKNNNSFTDVWLSGPAQFVFSGEINI